MADRLRGIFAVRAVDLGDREAAEEHGPDPPGSGATTNARSPG
jgi:hypothetical protein